MFRRDRRRRQLQYLPRSQADQQGPVSRSGHAVTDDQEWQIAFEIDQSHPHWLVMWGCYSRLFWAFPIFQAPKGTIVSAPNPEMLLAGMRGVEVEMSASQRVPRYSSPTSAAPLPRRLSRGQMERGAMAEGALPPRSLRAPRA
jgi:hypothetical protein